MDICKKKLGVQATQVLDPVFICDVSNYELLANNAERKTKNKFLFAYMLDPTIEKADALKKIAKKMRLKLVCITDKQFNAEDKANILRECGILENASIEELIYHIKNAEFVITDSYHGMCFSLIFKKSFLVLINRARGASRFDTLAEDFNIKDRMIETLDEPIHKEFLLNPMEFTAISKRIEEEIERSRQWLKNALFTKRVKSFSEYDLLFQEVSRMQDRLADLERKIRALEKNNQ